jgi:hypothetical protein
VAYPMSQMGHPRHFERASATSAMPPIATKSPHCGNRQNGPGTNINGFDRGGIEIKSEASRIAAASLSFNRLGCSSPAASSTRYAAEKMTPPKIPETWLSNFSVTSMRTWRAASAEAKVMECGQNLPNGRSARSRFAISRASAREMTG